MLQSDRTFNYVSPPSRDQYELLTDDHLIQEYKGSIFEGVGNFARIHDLGNKVARILVPFWTKA